MSDNNGFLPSMSQHFMDLYEMQHRFRERNPLVDAGIGLIPFVGAAAAMDDVGTSLSKGNYGEAAVNALGFIPGGKVVKGVFKGAELAGNAARKVAIANGKHYAVHAIGDAVESSVLGAGTISGTAYAAELMRRQAEQDANND
jgi:hypothetical protein